LSITYTPSTNFGAKDSLPSNDSNKVIRGSEFTTEFTAIQTAFGLAAPAASPTFTGTATLASVDINGGTIDGVTIGGSSAGAITGTTGQFNTSLNVDGTVTADGLEVFADGDVEINVDNDDTNGATSFYVTGRSGQEKVARFEASGDISFYEDTGTTAKLFWDASDESLDLSGRFYNTRGNHRGQIYGSGDNFIIRHDSSSVGLLALSRAGSLDLVVDSSGNVGIGTSTINEKLVLGSADSGSNFLQITNSTTTAANDRGLYVGIDANENARIIQRENADMFFSTNNTEVMTLDSSGDVGIGATSPSSLWGQARKLVVGNGTENTGISIYGVSTGNSRVAFVDTTTGTPGLDSGGLISYNHPNNSMDFRVNGSEAMRIESDGDVGIGTSSPAKKLHISAGVNATPTTFRIENTDTSIDTGQDVNTIEFYTNDASASGTGVTSEISQVAINAGNQYALTLSTYNASLSEKMRIDHDGNVGMLTASPLSRLHVNGGDGNNIRYQGATHTVAMGMTGADPFVGTVSNAPLLFLTNGSQKAQIDTSGNLVIGRSSAAAAASDAGHTLYGSGAWYIFGAAGQVVRFYETSTASQVGNITTTTSSTAYNTSSDARLKENIADAEDASSLVDAIKVRQFDWKADGSHQRYGMVAQELLEVAPEAVSQGETEEDMMGVDYSKLVPMLVKEIQSLRARVAQLEGA
jgi:hypothetical protein